MTRMTRKPRKREPRWISVLTIHALSANGLIDMLRYDRCWLISSEDTAKLRKMIEHRADRADRILQLLRSSAVNTGPDGRWRSFSCSILDERSPGMTQLTQDELLELSAGPCGVRATTLLPLVKPSLSVATVRRQRQNRFVSLMSVHAASAHAVIDVMQRDGCCPAYEAESAKIERLMGGDANPEDHFVRLLRYAATDDPPDEATWRTLGCEILDERNLDMAGPSDAELTHLASIPSDVRNQGARR